MAGRPLYNLPNATTVGSGDKFLIQQGVSSKQIDKDVLLTAENTSWEVGKSVGYSLNDQESFKLALLTEAGYTDSGLPDTPENSQRLRAILRLIASKSKLYFNNLKALIDYANTNTMYDGDAFEIGGNNAGYAVLNYPSGQGKFIYRANASKTLHDGGIVIDTTRTYPADINDKDSIYAWLTPSESGLGCLVRVIDKEILPEFWGAKADFTIPVDGIVTSTINMPMIQAAIDFAQKSATKTVALYGENYYIAPYQKPLSNPNLKIQLLVGSIWSQGKDYVNGVKIKGNGTSLFAGTDGRIITIGKAGHIDISGIKYRHYVGGTITGLRGLNDNAIRVCDGSHDINIFNNYLTNHLGWGIDVTSNAEDPASNLYMCRNINIFNNKIKTRFGNGSRAYNTLSEPMATQGTGGAWCIAVINGEYINIFDNTLIGNIDLENNNVSQTFNNIDIYGNRFQSGWVLPQATIGTEYWYDEVEHAPNTVGTSELKQGVLFNGVGLNETPRNISCHDNTYENALFKTYAKYKMSIERNKGYRGRIEVGYEQGGEQLTPDAIIKDNFAEVTPDPKGFVSILGLIPSAIITGNGLGDSQTEVISLDNIAGRNINFDCDFRDNLCQKAIDITSGIYRVTVFPFLTPTCTLNTAVFLYGGAGSGIISHFSGGMLGSTATFDVVPSSVGTPSGLISFGSPIKNVDGFTFDITVASGTGQLNFSSTESYANISVQKL